VRRNRRAGYPHTRTVSAKIGVIIKVDSWGMPMLGKSRYMLSGSPRNCAFCNEPLKEEAHRRGERYFCNELCADAARDPVRLAAFQNISLVA